MTKNKIHHLEICVQGALEPRMKILPMKKKMYIKKALFTIGQGVNLDMVLNPDRNKTIAYISATNKDSIFYLNQKQTENVRVFIHNDTNTSGALTVCDICFDHLAIKGFKELDLANITTEEINFGKKVRTLKMENVNYKKFGNSV